MLNSSAYDLELMAQKDREIEALKEELRHTRALLDEAHEMLADALQLLRDRDEMTDA